MTFHRAISESDPFSMRAWMVCKPVVHVITKAVGQSVGYGFLGTGFGLVIALRPVVVSPAIYVAPIPRRVGCCVMRSEGDHIPGKLRLCSHAHATTPSLGRVLVGERQRGTFFKQLERSNMNSSLHCDLSTHGPASPQLITSLRSPSGVLRSTSSSSTSPWFGFRDEYR
jgi:hypothetical protein